MVAEDHEGGRRVVHEMVFQSAFFRQSGQLGLIFLVKAIGVGGNSRWRGGQVYGLDGDSGIG